MLRKKLTLAQSWGSSVAIVDRCGLNPDSSYKDRVQSGYVLQNLCSCPQTLPELAKNSVPAKSKTSVFSTDTFSLLSVATGTKGFLQPLGYGHTGGINKKYLSCQNHISPLTPAKSKTMQKKTGIGIIGTGAVAEHHIKSIRELDSCHLVALASSSRERAVQAAEKYGIRVYEDYRELLKNAALQAVIICTHSGNHLEPTLAAAAAGKHVLVEKPLEVSLDRAAQMIEACNRAGIVMAGVFQNRFSPDFMRLKAAVTAGDLGKLTLGNAYIKWYRSPEYYSSSEWKGTLAGDGGAALINQGIHTIDLLLDIMGDVDSVFGKVRTVRHHIEGEDLGVALLSFRNGALGTIEGSTAIQPGYPERLEVYGEKGSVILEAGKIVHWDLPEQQTPPPAAAAPQTSGAADPMAIGHQLHKAQIADFVQAIQENRPPLVNGEQAKKALELILKIYESSRTGQEVFL